MTIELNTYIKNRMNELGIDNFHIKPFTVDINAGQQKENFNAFNEHIFLLSNSIPADIIIQSDTEIFFSVSNRVRVLPIEFSGQILIESSSTVDFTLEFLRVIPF